MRIKEVSETRHRLRIAVSEGLGSGFLEKILELMRCVCICA